MLCARSGDSRGSDGHAPPVVLGLALLVAVLGVPWVARQRISHLSMAQPWLRLDSALATTPPGRRIVYVRNDTVDLSTPSLVRNSVDGGSSDLQLMFQPDPATDTMLHVKYPDYTFWQYDAARATIRRLR